MSEKPQVLISGFADEGPVDKKSGIAVDDVVGVGFVLLQPAFCQCRAGDEKRDEAYPARNRPIAQITRRIRGASFLDWVAYWQGQIARYRRWFGQ